jgi:hypothetical protein
MLFINKKIGIPSILVFVILIVNDRIHRNLVPSQYVSISSLNDPSKLSRWGIDFTPFNYDESDLPAYLKDSIGILETDNSIIKTEKVYIHIIEKTEGMGGTPGAILNGKTPIAQLDIVSRGLSKIWCGNYGFLFPYFLQKSGVNSRYLSIGPVEGNEIGTHILTEVFIPELGKWVLVDPTYNYFLFKNREALPLSIAEIRLSKSEKDFSFQQWDKDSLVSLNKSDINRAWLDLIMNEKEVRYFDRIQFGKQIFQPSTVQRIVNYFFPSPVYYISKKPDRVIDNYTIWLIADIILISSMLFLGFSFSRIWKKP